MNAKLFNRIVIPVSFFLFFISGIGTHLNGQSLYVSYYLLWGVGLMHYLVYEYVLAPGREQIGYNKGRLEGIEKRQQMLEEFNTTKLLTAKKVKRK